MNDTERIYRNHTYKPCYSRLPALMDGTLDAFSAGPTLDITRMEMVNDSDINKGSLDTNICDSFDITIEMKRLKILD